MKRLTLIRDQWDTGATLGRLCFAGDVLAALERPWIPTDPGGKPFESCVPAGLYRLVRHRRPGGEIVLALINHGLAVYHYEHERPRQVGRYLILIHPANWVDQIAGCIAPGLMHALSNRGPMVTSSRIAMQRIMDYVSTDDAEIEIRQSWTGGQ